MCDPSQLYGFDLNMLVMFGMAVLIVYVAFHTPELMIVLDMSQEELEETEFKSSQALLFFFGASFMLLGLYLLMDYIMIILTLWVTFGATVAISILIQEVLGRNFVKDQKSLGTFRVPCIGNFNYFDVVCFAMGSCFSIGWLVTKNWVLNNILGTCMALLFLKTLRLNKLMPGVILLSLLFFYDIFWVFYSSRFTTGGQSVMVAVASRLEAPIKLMMPHITIDYPTSTCSMLGLGDIVIPGIFIGFLVRFGRIVTVSSNGGYSGYGTYAIVTYAASLLCCGLFLVLFKSA